MRGFTYAVTYGDRPVDARSVAMRLRILATLIECRSCPVHDMPKRPPQKKPGPEQWGPGTDSFLRLDGGREDVTYEEITVASDDPDDELGDG